MVYLSYLNFLLIAVITIVHINRHCEFWWHVGLLIIPAYLCYHYTWKLLEDE